MVTGIAAQTSSVSRANPATSGPGGSYTVRRGDTLRGIARQLGTDVGTLATLNGIRDPNRIYAGQVLQTPAGDARTYTVVRGDTLGAIARRHDVSLVSLIAANPSIRNANLIHPGQSIAIPGAASENRTSPSSVQRIDPVAAPRAVDGTLSLSAADVLNLKKVLQTEWVQSAGEPQARGIVDTILNRQASGR